MKRDMDLVRKILLQSKRLRPGGKSSSMFPATKTGKLACMWNL